MRNLIFTSLVFVSGAMTALVLPTVAGGAESTIESCGANLPAGHKVQFELTGMLDTTGPEARFRGNLGLTGDDALEGAAGVGDFVECVTALMN